MYLYFWKRFERKRTCRRYNLMMAAIMAQTLWKHVKRRNLTMFLPYLKFTGIALKQALEVDDE